MHRRRFPVAYRFEYPVFSLLLDIDAIDALAQRLPLFSHNRFNLLSFHDSDHGPLDGTPLRPWLNAILNAQGIDSVTGKVLLLAMPRVLGYVFNPLSVYYGFDEHAVLRAVVCEVKNTFGEQHCYVLHEHGQAMTFPVRQSNAKAFHVSPFMAIEGQYEFRISAPAEELSIGIRHVTERGTQLIAVQRGNASPVNTSTLLKTLLRTPLVTFKVITMIHWQALVLWLRKTPIYRHTPVTTTQECPR
jgi:DUF1365 family protein